MAKLFPSNGSRSARALCKQANPVEHPDFQAAAKRDMLGRLLLSAGIGLGMGVGGRSLVGAYREATRPTTNPFLHSSPVSTPLPVYGEDEEDEEPVPLRRPKAANQGGTQEPDTFQQVANHLPDFTHGDTQSQPWTFPAQVAAVGAPLMGGWALTDWLLKNRHKSDSQGAAEDAENEFERAMAAEYRAAMRGKTANEQIHPLAQAIDEFYDVCEATREKAAGGIGDIFDLEKFPWLPWRMGVGEDAVGQARGLIGAAALLSAAGAGTLAYKYTKSQSPDEALRKAIKLRARNRAAVPVAPYAVLTRPGG